MTNSGSRECAFVWFQPSLSFALQKKVQANCLDTEQPLKLATPMIFTVTFFVSGSRESAFVHAISSAGVVFAITRACSQGELKSCSCDPKKKGSAKDSKGHFDWGGCSDNIDYGIKFARAFVDAKERKGKDARALMNLHNNRAGRKVGVHLIDA